MGGLFKNADLEKITRWRGPCCLLAYTSKQAFPSQKVKGKKNRNVTCLARTSLDAAGRSFPGTAEAYVAVLVCINPMPTAGPGLL